MKNILTTMFVALALQASAQFTKGDKVLGGTISFNTQQTPDNDQGSKKTNTLSFSPTFGVLLNQNLEAGIQVGYSSYHYEQSTESYSYENDSDSWSTGVYIQRYFPLSEKFIFSLIGDVNYGKSKDSFINRDNSGNVTAEDTNKGNQLSIGIAPVFSFFPSQNWSIRTGIGGLSYSHYNNTSDDSNTNQFGLHYGSLSLGIAYYFRQ